MLITRRSSSSALAFRDPLAATGRSRSPAAARAPVQVVELGGPSQGDLPSPPVATPGPQIHPQAPNAPQGDPMLVHEGSYGWKEAIIGGIGGFITGGPAGAIAGGVAGALSNGSEPSSGGNPAVPGLTASGLPSQGCPPGTFPIPGTNRCADLQPGGATQGQGLIVPATSGGGPMFGGGGSPIVENRAHRSCGPGAVLARDGRCYDKRVVRNSDRMWPKGRKPLLTGGDLNAISRAARAARRVKGTSKKLQKLGLLPKPNRGAPRGSRGVITKAEAARALRS